MRKVFYILTLITFQFAEKICAQSLSRVIGATVVTLFREYFSFFTTGEVAVQTLTTTSSILTQGFQQANYSYLAWKIFFFSFSVSSLSNPTQDNLFVNFPNLFHPGNLLSG